jgi:flagellar biosynthesis/type III secretory pathway chaperone
MLTNIPSATLRQLVKLSERKEALMAQIQEIDREMARLQSTAGIPSQNIDRPASVTVSRATRRLGRRRRTKRTG